MDARAAGDMASLFRAADAGQNHHRFWVHENAVARNMAGITASHQAHAAGGDDDITAVQKMISAMSGSLLTSLLGMSMSSRPFRPLSPEANRHENT